MLVKLDDGQPLLAERPVGTGSVLLLGTAVHVDWTNLPLKPLFLPLLARLTFHLAGAEAERTMGLAGAPVTRLAGQGESVGTRAERCRKSRSCGPPGRSCACRRVDRSADGFRYAETHEAGVYLVRLADQKPPGQMAFAVNIDPAESDPATLTGPELQARFGNRPPCSVRESRAISPRRSAPPRRHQPVGVVPGGRADRAGAGGVPGEPKVRTGRGPRGNQGGWCNSRPVCRTGFAPLEAVATTEGDDVRGFLEGLEQGRQGRTFETEATG